MKHLFCLSLIESNFLRNSDFNFVINGCTTRCNHQHTTVTTDCFEIIAVR